MEGKVAAEKDRDLPINFNVFIYCILDSFEMKDKSRRNHCSVNKCVSIY